MNESLEERIKTELDRLVPLTSQPPNWAEVEQRSLSHSGGPAPGQPVARRFRARRLLVVGALLAVAIVSTAAYAVVRYAIVGSPAPPPVKISELVLNQIKNTITSFGLRNVGKVEIAKTRAAAVLATSSGPVYLWVAPTTTGSRCAYLQITGLDARFSGGTPFLMALQPAVCIDANQRQPFLNIINTGVQGKTLSFAVGYVPPPARTLQLLFANGTTSPRTPIRDGFVIVPGSPSDPRPEAVIRDQHGHLIDTSHAFLRPLFVSTSPVGPSQFTLTLRLRGNLGNLVLRVGPAARGGTCNMLTTPWGGSTSCGPDMTTADEINVYRDLFGNPRPPHQQIIYLTGQVGSSIATLELHYPDGSHKTLPIHHHWVLYQLNPNHPPNELIGRNQAGTIIATQRIYP